MSLITPVWYYVNETSNAFTCQYFLSVKVLVSSTWELIIHTVAIMIAVAFSLSKCAARHFYP